MDPEIAGVVRPASFTAEPVRVVEHDEALEAERRAATARMRTLPEPADVIAAVRTMYKRVGIDPTKTRPSSEALLRRVRKGDELPVINSLVDIINWCSLETQLPFGLYDLDRIHGQVVLRLGGPGEEYEGIRKAAVHVAGRLTLADEQGPFGNPTSDSARTMVTTATVRALIVIFVPAPLPEAAGEHAMVLTRDRITSRR
ncbi:MAG TPA: phenylalanine--tRNA ligase beta subunit-related protein [Vicinamibacterales bacterium]|nr:phenylalanine--tRNA ligase beta subunit-related protein [Vicinamibacterales bacterium]